MNSLDPWRIIATNAYGDVVLPRPRYGHPFYSEVPSWIHYGEGNGTTRQLFDGAFISGDPVMSGCGCGGPVVSGFFDSVKSAVLKYTGTSATNQFIKDKGLEPYVKMAATAVATYYGGPAAGAAAGAIQPYLSKLGTKDKQKEAEGKKQLQQVKTAVQQRSPELAPAVDVAQDAIQKTATTYHVAQITNDAKAGNPDAQRALDNLKQAAGRGDAEAQQALQLADVIEREQSKGGARSTVSGWVDIIGANMTNIIGAELTALSAPGYALPGYGYPAYGYGYGPFRPYGGIFFGAEAPPVTPPIVAPGAPPRKGLLAEVAPVVAPATGEIAVKKELDPRQVLHVEICVDGKCYKTSMDLAPAIELVMKRLAEWHKAVHAAEQPPAPPTVVSRVQNAISAAGDAMADVMVGHHVAVMTSGWLSDIGGALGGTLRKLGPVISTVATGVATAYGGPAAGAAAAKFAPMITNLQANALDPKGDPKKKAQAQQRLQQLSQQAKTDPAMAQALQAANQAVKNTAVAYHVKDTAQRATVGDKSAQTDISNLVKAAEQGDPAAKSTFDVLAQTFAQEMMKSETGAKLWEQVTGRGPGTVSPGVSGWYDIIGAVASPILIAVLDEDGNATDRQVMWHPTHDQIQRFGGKTPKYYTEDEGGLFLFADPNGEALEGLPGRYTVYVPSWDVMYWKDGGAVPRPSFVKPRRVTTSGQWYDIAVGQWYDIIGAAIDDVREKARTHAVTKPGNAAGVIITVDGRLRGRGFRNLDAAIDWLQQITRNRGNFTYAAAYEKDTAGQAYIQAEELGGARTPTEPGTPIPREVATTSGWYGR